MIVQDHISMRSEKTSLDHSVNENYMDNIQIILHEQESLPEIYSIKKIYIDIAMGRIAMQLDDQGETICTPGNVIDVPRRTKMKIKNISSYKTAILIIRMSA